MLIVHRSERADALLDALGSILADPLGDPVAAELVCVPTRGVERWLGQGLAHRLGARSGDGVAANIRFPFPGSLIGEATSAACGIPLLADPWRPERSAWPLVEVIDEHWSDPALAPLVEHLKAATPLSADGEPAFARRWPMARHLADLFDRYALHRPDMVRAWARGPGGPLFSAAPSTEDWQAHLWRLLRAHIGVASPAERLQEATARLAAEPGIVDWPERLSVFGLTRLPASHLRVLEALGRHRDVHLFLLHPSRDLWERLAAEPVPADRVRRAEDPTVSLVRHPLLRSWGRDSREMQLTLGAARAAVRHHEAATTPASVLSRLQSDVRADRAQEPGRDHHEVLPTIEPEDRSIQIHACHGRARQVEAVRDAVLHLLDGDPTLELRDVIVMCPDIESFAPLVQAVFGPDPGRSEIIADRQGDGSGPPLLRVRLADRSLRQTNPLLGVADELLRLAGSRVTASEVADLMSRPPVSRRFGFDQDDLSTIAAWLAGSGVRWGLDGAHRRAWSLGHVEANTWSFGLDRLLLGVAMADDSCRVFGDTAPFGDVPSTLVDLAGRLAELVDRLDAAMKRLAGEQTLSAWLESLLAATEAMTQCVPGDEWQIDQLRTVLTDVASEAAPLGHDGTLLVLAELQSLLSSRLQGQPTRANFRTGDLTVCTLVPMRSVPHRVVCLLGLDDGSFPRHPESDGDDLLLSDPHVGDRDTRFEDRQLLLDALMAAQEHLVITYSGRDERTNRPLPPCVPVAELLDVLDVTVAGPDARPARKHLVTHHPLQSFDPRNFAFGLGPTEGPWSYDTVSLEGARAALGSRPRRPWLESDLPAQDEPVLQIDQLVSFAQHPVRAFLRRRLGLYLGDRDEELIDSLSLDLGPLEKWAVGDRLLEACLSGVPLEQALTAELARGFLPPGDLARQALDRIASDVGGLMHAVGERGLLDQPGESAEVHIDLPDGSDLVGTVPNVRGDFVLLCTYSRLAPKHRLANWIRFLALTADRSERPIRGVGIGRGQGRQAVRAVALAPLAADPEERRRAALDRLAVVVDLYRRGMAVPLPIACNTSAAWAEARAGGQDATEALRRAEMSWSDGQFPGEQSDPEHVHVWGASAPLSVLLAEPPRPDEDGPGWTDADPHRFGRLAGRLWRDLLAHESRGDGE